MITASLGYHNEYTRMSMSELIKRLVGKCGPDETSKLCNYITNITNSKDEVIPLGIGPGVYESIW